MNLSQQQHMPPKARLGRWERADWAGVWGSPASRVLSERLRLAAVPPELCSRRRQPGLHSNRELLITNLSLAWHVSTVLKLA